MFPSNKPGPHTGQRHRSCLNIRQLINIVEYLSIYSKDYLQSYHTHVPVSSFGTKKMQRKRVPLCMYMAAEGIKGLIYLEARACFSVRSGIRKFWGCHAHFRSRWMSELKATLGLVKCLEISKELIRECVTMPGCCCCMPLLHNHLMDSCTVIIMYAKIHYSPPKGGAFAPPLPPLNPPLLTYLTKYLVSLPVHFYLAKEQSNTLFNI